MRLLRHSDGLSCDAVDRLYEAIMWALLIGVFLMGVVIAHLPKEEPQIVTVIIRESDLRGDEISIEDELLESALPREIPMTDACVSALEEACECAGVPIAVALGLIETESTFKEGAVSKAGCYGLCQLNPQYFPRNLSPEDNIRHGIAYLGYQLRRYGNWESALTAYNAGYDTGSRVYASAVLSKAVGWGWEVEAWQRALR